MDSLSFRELREANAERCVDVFHPIEEWSETDWACAMAGEAGEACNLVKKRRRGEDVPVSIVAKELADAVIYADLLAERMGIDLGQAVRQKFNEVSRRKGSRIFLPEE